VSAPLHELCHETNFLCHEYHRKAVLCRFSILQRSQETVTAMKNGEKNSAIVKSLIDSPLRWSSAPCRVGYLLMSVYTKKRDLPTYPEPPRGVTALLRHLPTYLSSSRRPLQRQLRPCYVVTSSCCPTHSFSLRRRRRKKSDVGRLCALFSRAPPIPRFAAVCPHLFPLSLRAFIGHLAARCVGRTSIRPVTGERCLDYVLPLHLI